MIAETDTQIRDILQRVKTIALVGASAKPQRPSHRVMGFLLGQGYTVWPVNPGQEGKEIHGQYVYAKLADLPGTPDMVDVFRASSALPGVVEDVLKLDPLPDVLWTQLGVFDSKALERTSDAGITVVADRCPAIEYPRLGLGHKA